MTARPLRLPKPRPFLGGRRWLREPLQTAIHLVDVVNAPRGNGQPVLTLPGFMAADLSMRPIRDYLWWLGYNPYGWRAGINNANIRRIAPKVISRVERLADRHEEPLVLVGWSMGGVLARQIAQVRPDLVRAVITLGSPVLGNPKSILFTSLYKMDVPTEATEIEQPRPVTAFYSKADLIVDWRACLDHENEHVKHHEVATTHTGFTFSPEVLLAIANQISTFHTA